MERPFQNYFESLFTEVMVFDGQMITRGRIFSHYVLNGVEEKEAEGYWYSNQDMMDYLKAKAAFF